MSLNSHLETHPKDQVIEALVRAVSDRERAGLHPHSAIINPFQVVSEEHIFFGRQQVTTNILAPLMTYPIYQQQQVLHGSQHHEQFIQQSPQHAQLPQHPHQDDHSDTRRHPELPAQVAANATSPGNEVITTLINVQPGQQEFRQANAETVPLPIDEVEEKCDYEEKVEDADAPMVIHVSDDEEGHTKETVDDTHQYAEATPTSVIHTPIDHVNNSHSVIALTNVERDSSQDQFITSDFQDEDARHSEDFIDDSTPASDYEEDDDDDAHLIEHQRRLYLEEQEDDVEARSDSGLQNIQADECMPARGELSGHGSVNTVHSWDHDEIGMPAPIWEGKTESLKRYPCLYCDEDFPCPKERRVHVASIHCASDTKSEILKSQRAIMCIKCGLQLESLKDLRVHIKMEHKKVTRQCCVCQEEFKSQEEYTEHIVKVHPLECRTCGKTFKSKASLVGHAKIHLIVKPHACTLCPKTFITNQKLKEHMNGHTGYAPIQCNMCDKKFKRYSNLKQHKDTIHFQLKKQVKEFFCECGETFSSKKKLEWHQETHDDKPKQCMYCSERYIHMASLTRHIRKAHNNEYLPTTGVKKKNVVCPICNLTFVDTSLRAHMKQHGTVKQFGCIVCGKKFYTKWNLHLHRWTHASRMSKPYKCTLCKSAFVRQSDLQAHIRAHFNSKPFTCNHCGMQFNRKHNWSRHEKEHLNEKKFVCNECGKTFHRQYYLVEHMRTHTGAKPFSCHICNKTSSTKSNHNKHIKTHHAREAVNTES
ncbi:hypothetical protein GE061_011008 [Apolygus lucorum]|uniref:C2H2-type domain-containing protein n=1 Tax=Apolygus lucorum TaxID=248454 RepID=A0A6A4IND5_APOLU|nr:hypothetical protein GE061_011008 [Apolygus lucorum]